MRSLFSVALLTLFLSSCRSSHFETQWRSATAKNYPSKSIEGPWQGTWLSHGNGHHGKLRCIVGPASGKAGAHTFDYHATWAHLLSGGFSTAAVVKQKGDTASFKGEQCLGKYGTFECDALIKAGQFHSTYKAAGDHGVFEMTRP
jgi:hypothetical protein